ncbi:MBL fold metallo-hydrolase [Yinghuangia aomiensis]|uniref:MBL fold metallo-hydrolase n=1 Tax=Yinghuangia aomiensis TaxID=676205 RepID=UPI0031E60B41
MPAAGIGAVNAYLIDDQGGPVLIDPGWAQPATEQALGAALRTLGYTLDDVASILVTHAHKDHYTQALDLRRRFGAQVRLGRGERAAVAAHRSADGEVVEAIAVLRRCGADKLADVLAESLGARPPADLPTGMPDEWLDHGEKVGLAARKLDVFATPGHTRGHIVFRDAAAGLLFAGDHVLPHIVPALDAEPLCTAVPLRDFLASLELVRGMSDTLLLPAHGPVVESTHRRVDELLDYHGRRLDAAIAHVRAGRRTAFAVAAATPWARRGRSLGELAPVVQALAVRETAAQLALLADRGVLRRYDADGVDEYEFA